MSQGYPPPSGYGPPQAPGYGPPPQGYGPPGYGGPPPKKGMSPLMIVLIIGGCLFGGCVTCGVIGAIAGGDKDKKAETPSTTTNNAKTAATDTSSSKTATDTTAAATTTADTPKADPLAALPATEKKFCTIVVGAGKKYKSSSGENELKLSKIRGDRRNLLNATSASVTGWSGTIESLSTNSEGKAILSVKLPCGDDDIDVLVQTWNNGLSDIEDNTLIPQSSKLYTTLSDLGTGKEITFSGTFLTGDETNGFHEASMSESGSMTSPEFIFRFSSAAAKP